ncbi:molybdopterin molybdotransferase MoeA [Terriglobus roseus]|uniref:Molybdopterin molybdenumtransferase n=1 Tax=Terriglobus roseus TaxID=392734 RepID=A0A1H4M8J3_9BACT|nr:gephyrin-like molybdotransferase Glp [Terriglobus roseus]SEB79068.1 molybdopterin molybdochelatase [Terriglobus roseus]
MALLSCSDALQIVASKMPSQALSTATERIPLTSARGRVLAQAIMADRDQPPFPRSTRDGFALRSSDANSPMRLIGAIRAGEQWTGAPLQPGEALEIMTGAPVPEGADAVVMVEHVTIEDAMLTLQPGRTLSVGENIVPRAAEARAGDVLLQAGVCMGAAEIALAASVGAAEIAVFAQPVVAVLATGDELVALDITPDAMQIRNSNSHALAALVQEHGGVARILPPAADTRESLHAAITGARDAAMLVLSGGVSAGKYDFVEDVLLSLGAEFFFTGVAMQPGKPAVFGRIPPTAEFPEQWLFGLPGNPVSTQVTALLFAMPMVRALAGEAEAQANFALAKLTVEVKVRPGLTRFLPARMDSSLAGATVKPTGWQGSGDLNANARANCYLVVPPDATALQPGDVVTVLLRSR